MVSDVNPAAPLADLHDLDALARRYERPLRAYGGRRLADHRDVDELVQETLVRLWRMGDRFDPARGTVDGMVFTIASRVLVDILRRRRPTEALGEAHEPAQRDHAEATEAALVVRVALASLSADHRQVVELAYFDGLSQPQIADRLGLALGTVKTRTMWALRNLHAALAPGLAA